MTDLVYAMVLFKNWEQSRRVIDRLDAPGVSFVIHIDQKTDEEFVSQARAYLAGRPNCHFIRRENVRWGAWGLVQVMLNGMRYVEDHAIPCDAFIYMSGQDYPIVSHAVIADHFARHPGRQFLENFALPSGPWPGGGMDRVSSYHFQVRGRHFAYPPRRAAAVLPRVSRRLPGGYDYFGGSAAIILAANGVAYVNAFVGTPLGRRLVRYMKYSRHPDELFFQTTLMNSDLRETVVNDELRYIDWEPVEGPPPKILRIDDLPRLRSSGKLFARKFDERVDSDVLDALDREAHEATEGDT